MKDNTITNEKHGYFGSYKKFIRAFKENGYQTEFFTSEVKPEKALLLRHDVDFDCGYANEIASLEYELDVKATYFFLLCNNSYNLLSKSNIKNVLEIKEKGHEISLHFDPLIYGDDFLEGFKFEKEVFEKTFKTKINIVSIHRPNAFFLNFDEKIGDTEHTYQKKYFKDIKYISDSGGNFRFGHPLESEEFKNKNSIHLLIHPIWWRCAGENNIDVLHNHIENRTAFLKSHIGENCIPYQEYLDKK